MFSMLMAFVILLQPVATYKHSWKVEVKLYVQSIASYNWSILIKYILKSLTVKIYEKVKFNRGYDFFHALSFFIFK
jgi:hypothetical protein